MKTGQQILAEMTEEDRTRWLEHHGANAIPADTMGAQEAFECGILSTLAKGYRAWDPCLGGYWIQEGNHYIRVED